MHSESGPVIIAVEVPEDAATKEIRKVGREIYFEGLMIPEEVGQDFGLVCDMIFKCSKPIIDSFELLGKEKVPPKKATAEYSLSFNAKGNIYLVEASMDGTIKVSFEWELQK